MAQGKNLIGAFHQPSAVLSDIAALRTLPEGNWPPACMKCSNAAPSAPKHCCAIWKRTLSRILNCRPDAMQHIVMSAARIKADVVAADEKENGLRMILNFGHTIGHAFEAATDYRRFKHGEAVAWGMIAALAYGSELGLLAPADSESLIRLIRSVGRLPSLNGISIEKSRGIPWSATKNSVREISAWFFCGKPGEAEIRTGIDAASLQGFLEKFLAAKGI